MKGEVGKARKRKRGGGGGGRAALVAGGEGGGVGGQGSAMIVEGERQVATTENKFYCNTKALTPEGRARHKQLREKLAAARKELGETEKGYEFQYSPADISLAEFAEGGGAEGKGCPFLVLPSDVVGRGNFVSCR